MEAAALEAAALEAAALEAAALEVAALEVAALEAAALPAAALHRCAKVVDEKSIRDHVACSKTKPRRGRNASYFVESGFFLLAFSTWVDEANSAQKSAHLGDRRPTIFFLARSL